MEQLDLAEQAFTPFLLPAFLPTFQPTLPPCHFQPRRLNASGYVATERNPRWQFEKTLSEERKITVDLHTATGAKLPPSVTEDHIRLKHKPSLGDTGVQARKNPEATGCDRHPFQLTAEGPNCSGG